jgi:hypothetical protein
MIFVERSKKTQTEEIVEQFEDPKETPNVWSKHFWIFWDNKMVDEESHIGGGGRIPKREGEGERGPRGG